MRVLILTITAGEGHHAAGKAVSDALITRGAQVLTVDVYKEVSSLLYHFVNQGYLLSSKYTRKPYRFFYKQFEKKTKTKRNPVFNLPKLILRKKLKEKLVSFNPDFIICTHTFAASVVDELKKQNIFASVPTMGLVTDYTLHPFWQESPRVEYINLAHKLCSYKTITKGIAPSKILSFGIPIHEKFSNKMPKEKACEILGIPFDKPVVLIMGGSMGYGNMTSLVKQIESANSAYTLLVVCGRNTRQKKKILKLKPNNNRRVYGFVDNIDIMMDAADCIITKPGGITVSETMSKNLPMILVNPVPGHEDRNLDFLINNGVALSVSKTFSINEALYFLFDSPGRLEAIRDRLFDISNPDATKNIVNFIYEHEQAVKSNDN